MQLTDYIIYTIHKFDDHQLNEYLDNILSINDLKFEDIVEIAKSYIKTFDDYQEPMQPDLPLKEFKTVSQAPSESESEEISYKRQKLQEDYED